jgi:CheY-like chemotaxis protein
MPTAGESSLDLAYKLRYFLTIAAAVFLSVGIFAALFVSGELSRPFLEVKGQDVRPCGMNGAAKNIADGTPQGKLFGDDPRAGLVLSSSPADTPNFARKGSADVKPARAKLPGARVLVVGGAETDLDAARESLKPYGMRVDCVTSGRSAVKSIREGMAEYDAVFMDQNMPDIDGVEAARIIREDIGTRHAKNIPLIALSADALDGAEKIFLERGFQALLAKPMDTVELDEIVNQWIWERKVENFALEDLDSPEVGILALDPICS